MPFAENLVIFEGQKPFIVHKSNKEASWEGAIGVCTKDEKGGSVPGVLALHCNIAWGSDRGRNEDVCTLGIHQCVGQACRVDDK